MMEELYNTQLQADLAEFDKLVTYVSMKEGLGPEDAVVRASTQTNAAQAKLNKDFPEETNTLKDSLAYMNNLYKPMDLTPTSPNMDKSQRLEQEVATDKVIQAQDKGIRNLSGYKDFSKDTKILTGKELSKNTYYGAKAINKVESIEGPLSRT